MLLLYSLLVTYLLFIGFMVYAAAKRSWSRLKVGIKILLLPTLLAFGLLDVGFNVTVGSVLFLELPRELTFSERCTRHFCALGWRGGLARAFATPLNAVDDGHIGGGHGH